ncbi:hypothetical protein IEQ34_016907 [Dendrobium chrysotoxum]|uniref:Uncharacterized protein n=1 Tax=Dendrobium chrysotoxum TaxID=161865 RepID=A0AAV7GHV3_DENCH|nr:hypothetical protein IEQ34_016907 [Dendrobium chrysotoxum]
MASISSKCYQYVPPFLRSLNLSNQYFSFLQKSNVSIINDHCPVIHTKSPSPPRPFFLTRNPPLGHFLSMATSTARIPSNERRHHQPSSLDHVHSNNSFPKKYVETYIPLTAQSFSLMRMWMDSEAEARLYPAPHTSMAVTLPTATAEEPSTRLDACEVSEFFEKEIMGNVSAAALFPSPSLSSSPALMSFIGNALKVTGRQEIEDFILKLEEGRREEVAALGELHPVSRFPFLGRIQLLIKLRSLRQELTTIIYQQLSENLRERFDAGSNNFLLREHDMSEFPSEESGAVMEIQLFDSHFSVYVLPMDHSNGENNQFFLELICSREIESPPQAFYSLQTFFAPPFRHKDQQKWRSSEASWDWQKPVYCHMLQTLHNEAASIGTSAHKQYVAFVKHNWPFQPSTLRKGCG